VLPEPRWPVIRLEESLGEAEVTCIWEPKADGSEPLVALGPFRTDRPRRDLQVKRAVHRELGPCTVLSVSGFEVLRGDVGRILIEIHAPYGRHIDLTWSGSGKIRVPLPGNNQFWPLSIATDGLVDWSGLLEELRIRTDGVGAAPVQIRSIRFMPRQDAFPEPAGVRRVQLDVETRTAIYAHCPVTVEFADVTLPQRAKLQVGLGHVFAVEDVRGNAAKPGGSSASASESKTGFEVAVVHDDQETVVLSETLDAGERWTDVSVGLEAWGGQTVSLVFRAVSKTFGSVALWANPFIYEPVEDPPCLVLYLIDTLAAKHMDLYGYERPTTPNITKLAGAGVAFTRAFCNSPVTVASVPDTQFSMPTERHGVYASSIAAPDELVSLADVLRTAGFATALFSTNAHAGPRQNTDQGFDHFVYRLGPGWEGFPDRTVPLEDVGQWLEVHGDRPTFIYIHTTEPHAPYLPPEGFAGRFDPNYVGFVTGLVGHHGSPAGLSEGRLDRDVAHVRALYDEEVLYADARFGMFRELLGELGLGDRANIFLIADHGEELFEHGHWGHGPSLHTEVMHVPLVVAGPLVTARGTIDVPVQLQDVMPTILEMFDLPEPYELTGTSLLPFLRSGGQPDVDAFAGRTIFHSHHRYFGRGIVQYAVIEAARWKLMYSYEEDETLPGGGATRWALYDLQDFLYDRENVIDAHRDVARRLVDVLIAYRQQQHPHDPTLQADELKFDPEQLRELQALGYVGGAEDEDDE
jgi:arylsulfatase A-like enzyme